MTAATGGKAAAGKAAPKKGEAAPAPTAEEAAAALSLELYKLRTGIRGDASILLQVRVRFTLSAGQHPYACGLDIVVVGLLSRDCVVVLRCPVVFCVLVSRARSSRRDGSRLQSSSRHRRSSIPYPLAVQV